jgi:hypothetical protein
MGEVEADYPTGFGHLHLVTSVVTPRRANDAHPGDNCRRPRQFNGLSKTIGGEIAAASHLRFLTITAN